MCTVRHILDVCVILYGHNNNKVCHMEKAFLSMYSSADKKNGDKLVESSTPAVAAVVAAPILNCGLCIDELEGWLK